VRRLRRYPLSGVGQSLIAREGLSARRSLAALQRELAAACIGKLVRAGTNLSRSRGQHVSNAAEHDEHDDDPPWDLEGAASARSARDSAVQAGASQQESRASRGRRRLSGRSSAVAEPLVAPLNQRLCRRPLRPYTQGPLHPSTANTPILVN
jgi:hypothetical protein